MAGVNRRTLLRGVGALVAAPLLASTAASAAPAVASGIGSLGSLGLWSSPATWPGGRVPGPADRVVVDRPVLLDISARVARLEVAPGGELLFHPGTAIALESTGNVVVRGVLRARPTSPASVHVIRFVGVRQSRFRGDGMAVLESDIGLWVVDAGVLDLAGTPKMAWSTLATGHAAGERLALPYAGWLPGDRVVITPTVAPSSADDRSLHQFAYDDSALDAALTTEPLYYDHPLVGDRWGAEVLNLSRNVVIEGTPGGKAHVFITSSSPQSLRHVELRHLGVPNVKGRYALHFHMCGDGSRGSVVEGTVVHDCGHHAFVPHESHGVTFRECISHNTVDDAFWWDERPFVGARGDDVPQTHGTRWEGCVASLVWAAGRDDQNRLSAFTLGRGDDNVCTGCVSVGVNGRKNSAGFRWPEMNISIRNNVWTFTDNLAHNCLANGINSWQNDREIHIIERFTAYHCRAGIDQGAYSNRYHYRDVTLYGNAETGMRVHAMSPDDGEPLRFERIFVDGAGLGGSGLLSARHHHAHFGHVLLEQCDFRNVTRALVFQAPRRERKDGAERYSVRDCRIDGSAYWVADDVHAESIVTVDDGVSAFELRRHDQPGEFVEEWNASRTWLLLPEEFAASDAASTELPALPASEATPHSGLSEIATSPPAPVPDLATDVMAGHKGQLYCPLPE